MRERSGRLEKRVQLAVPVEISTSQEPVTSEQTSTLDVCSNGARVLTQQPRERNQPLVMRSLAGGLRAQARVVYCQKLPDGRFAVGIQFVGTRISEW